MSDPLNPKNKGDAIASIAQAALYLRAGVVWFEDNSDTEDAQRWKTWVHLALTSTADVAEFLAGVPYGTFLGSGGGPKGSGGGG